MGIIKALFTQWQIDAERLQRERRERGDPCSCEPGQPDDQCPTHGYEAWKASRQQPD
jgi:hypothetical protein